MTWRQLMKRALGVTPSRSSAACADSLAAAIRAHLVDDHGSVVVLLDQDAPEIVAVTRHLPSVELRAIVGRVPTDQIIAELRSHRRPCLIVDARTKPDHEVAREIIWALPSGGSFVALNGGARWQARLRAAAEPESSKSAAANRRRGELSSSIDLLPSDAGASTVRKRHDHHHVLRHHEVEPALEARFGASWGEVLTRRPARSFDSLAHLVMHGDPPGREKQRTIQVPELSLRRYHGATCHAREIVTRDDLILPETYRHWQSEWLFHKRIHQATKSFARLGPEVGHTSVRHEPGEFFSLDSAFPTHFGHMTTETLAKVWGWSVARDNNPDVRVVMTHQTGKDRLPVWKAQILAALDIPVDDILWVTPEQSVTVDSLVAAMPQLANPTYIDPGIADTWSRLRTGIGPDPMPGSRAEKIFVSRRLKTQRHCVNTAELEAFMVQQGFTVLLPEDMSYVEQVHAFTAAKVIAGFGGSGLFNMMFNPSAKVVILTSRTYTAANEYLIASVGGNEIHYFWAPPLTAQTHEQASFEAYRSAFAFPLDQHREALVRALS